MRAVRNNPNRAPNYFQDFSKCLSIFNKALKLQKNRKKKTKQENRERERLTWRPPSRSTCRPSPATAPASCLAWPGRQAAARRRAQHAFHAAARRLAAPLVELSTWDEPPLSPRPRRHSLFPLAPLSRPPRHHPRRHHRCRSPQTRPTPSPHPLTVSGRFAVVDYVD